MNKNIVPSKQPGTLLDSFTGGDESLGVRYFVFGEPLHYELLNRPLKDIELRQLILAKTIDTLQIAYGSSLYYPFIVQPIVTSGNDSLTLPTDLVFDMTISIPANWSKVRLARIKRISGTNGTGGYTGTLRFIFSAIQNGSSQETYIAYADYVIDSNLSYQQTTLKPILPGEETDILSADDRNRFNGLVTFTTQSLASTDTLDLLSLLAPPTNTTLNTNGEFVTPAVYDIADSLAGSESITGDFSAVQISHGTGLLTDGAVCIIPDQVVSSQGLLDSLNYPFDANATLISVNGIQFPPGLFAEFNIIAPGSDKPTSATPGSSYYPVWLSRIQRVSNNQIRLYFSTYLIGTDEEVEFAILDLLSNYTTGTILEILPYNNLKNISGINAGLYSQAFGLGHVKLSSVWSDTSGIIDQLFSDMIALGSIESTSFTISSTRISALGLNRSPVNLPTVGESQALAGTSARRSPSIPPSNNNRFVTELDEGFGPKVDFRNISGLTSHAAIDNIAYASTIVKKTIYMVINDSAVTNEPNFYTDYVLPRLTILLGRPPVFGDEWYDGFRFKRFNGNAWQG